MFQNTLSRLLSRHGYHLLSDWRLRHWPLSSHLRTLFAMHRVSLVLDVGANCGQYGQFLRQHVRWDGPIVSFEPVPANLPTLRQIADTDGNWIVYPCALGRHAGTLPINVMRSTQLSSFHQPVHPLPNQDGIPYNVVTNVVSVDIRTVADVWPEITARFGPARAHLKMDTQGYDLEVFAGAAPVLPHIATAQSEISFLRLYDAAPDYHVSLQTFSTSGFVVSGMFAVNHEHDTLQAREFDCTLVNLNSTSAS